METHKAEEPFNQFEGALKRLLKPAGDDPRFASFELLKQNPEAFVLECHKTYKELHYLSIKHQLALEKLLEKRTWQKAVKVNIQYLKLLWKRINDTIVWQFFQQQRHQVKRLCMRQPRRPLSACKLE